ncbi:MAG TPA: MarR family transcriptional regulator [Jatrophihabitans sp.]|nr:MarR family transcriptional regulator [Jatrophihabitans sp.]
MKTKVRPRAEVAEVADNVAALMRSFGKARARLLAAAEHDVEWSAHMLLKILHNEGPMRAGAVAECLRSDPSTVSRQVASLVKDGLLERRSDPDDGRASLLVLTDKADAVLAEHDRIRNEHFAQMLDDWSDTDLHRFAALLQRFTRAHEAANDNWISERVGARTGTAS